MNYLIYLIFRCDFGVMESWEEWEVTKHSQEHDLTRIPVDDRAQVLGRQARAYGGARVQITEEGIAGRHCCSGHSGPLVPRRDILSPTIACIRDRVEHRKGEGARAEPSLARPQCPPPLPLVAPLATHSRLSPGQTRACGRTGAGHSLSVGARTVRSLPCPIHRLNS